jgi:D-lactate dehydrogenase (cytochrome)
MSRLPDIIQETKDDISQTGLLSGMVGHVGDGNFHSKLPPHPPLSSKAPNSRQLTTSTAILLFNESERKVAEDVVHRMVKRAVEMEGTVTGEHGVGLIKRDYLSHELGESTVDAMRRVSFFFFFLARIIYYYGHSFADQTHAVGVFS